MNRRHYVKAVAVVAVIAVCGGVTVSAQWRDVVTKVPVTPAGTPDYGSPAPKTADGKTPDLSGLWDAERQPCTEAIARLGCLDAVTGLPLAAINIATGSRELPMQP